MKNHAPLSIDETNLYALRNIEEITNETEEISDDFNADFNQELTDIISDNPILYRFDNLPYEKSWFCGTCLKHFTKLTYRLQRACEYCKTR